MPDDQSEIISFLSEPESYGLCEPVERIDTHAAMVFLAGDRAFKLKRAVTYLYLDYGTAELREKACRAELEFNRRTAPRLYLEVASVNRDASGRLSFAPGDPVDWLVVMRRFPQDCLLERVCARGELTDALARRLAENVASFHAMAAKKSAYGGARDMRELVEWNRTNSTSHAGALAPALVEELHLRCLEEVERLAPLLEDRRAKGWVRRCHGDLHLSNIVLLDGEPTLFDGIEFSERIASTDVLYDLAFLLMDLWRQGEQRAANLVFNRYLDCSEWSGVGGLAAMPLFLAVRAGIRAHVRAAGAARQADPAARARCEAEAGLFLASALEDLTPRPPLLLAIGGLSGSGKSTLAQALASRLGRTPGARVLRSDILRKRLAGVAPEQRLPAAHYTREASVAVYARLYVEAAAVLRTGYCVVVDAVFARAEERGAIAAVAAQAGVPFLGLWLEAPLEVAARRLAARTGDASDATPAVLTEQRNYALGELGDWMRLEAGGDPGATEAAALTLLKRFPGCLVEQALPKETP